VLFRREEEWKAAFTFLCKGFPDFWTGHYGFASTNREINTLSFFQDYFTKWPMVFAVPDRIVELLTKEVILFCGVPEAVLTDVVIYAKPMGAIFLSNENNWV